MKTLNTKKINLAICWNGLRNIQPKDFPTIPEMESTVTILSLLKEQLKDFSEIIGRLEDINAGDEKDADKKRAEALKDLRKVESQQLEDEATIEFENADFNIFFQQFERWGKNWFAKVDVFLNFRKDMNLTNSQPK
jgi:hypothetical protein